MTMKSHLPFLVIGGTRGTGLLIARLLHRQGIRVRVLARDRERALPHLLPFPARRAPRSRATRAETGTPATVEAFWPIAT